MYILPPQRFALQSLQYLLADFPPFQEDSGDMGKLHCHVSEHGHVIISIVQCLLFIVMHTYNDFVTNRFENIFPPNIWLKSVL